MKTLPLFLLITFLSFALLNKAQGQPSEVDPTIKEMVNEISATNLKSTIDKLVSFETRHSLSTTRDPKRGIGAARNWIETEFKKYVAASNGRLTVKQDTFTVFPDGKRVNRQVVMANVMATLKGTDPTDDRVLIISGHLDSRNTDIMDSVKAAPGANDDAAGVAIVMEMTRILSKMEFPCTIIFVAVQGEEQGLLGAKHLSKKAKKENWNVHAMITNDISGNSYSSETGLHDNTRLRVFSEGVPVAETKEEEQLRKETWSENDSKARQFARYIKEQGERYVEQYEVVMIYRNDRFLRGGDHIPFSQEGYTAVRITEMNENYNQQHQDVRIENEIAYGDLEKHIDYEYLRKNTGVNLAAIASLASSPTPPENVQILITKLTNKTSLQWDAPKKGKKPAGYYVLMRETTETTWTKKFFVKENEFTLSYSKDNYLFAVQTVDENGHTGLPVIPKPKR
jgi:Zn-dependent M28 family amino/carboxypeptidase